MPLPKQLHAPTLGESRSHAVQRFLSLERSLHSRGDFEAFDEVMQEYFVMQHVEIVPAAHMDRP